VRSLSKRFRKAASALSFLCFGLLCGGISAAQTPASPPPDSVAVDTAVTLQPIKVRASIFPSAGANVGSGIPARTAQITPARAGAWPQSSLPIVLSSQPGISIQDDIGQSNKLSVSARGFTAGPTIGIPSGLSVFLDGVRQNEPDEQEVNFDLLPMESVERVEVLSGSGSLLGPNSLGGGINLVTTLGDQARRSSLEVAGTSWEGRSAGAVASGPIGGESYYAAGGYERENGWRTATSSNRYNALINIHNRQRRHRIVAQLFAAGSSAETAGSLPESEFKRAPRANFTPGDFDNLAVQQVSFSDHWLSGEGIGFANIYARHSSAQRFNVNQGTDPNVRGFTDNQTLGGTIDWRKTAALRTSAVSMRAGIDAAINAVKASIFAESLGAGGRSRQLTTKVRSPSSDIAPYLISELRTPRASLSIGARYDVVSVPLSDEIRLTRSRNLFRRFSPRAGFTASVGDGLSLFGSVGAGFRAPAILELGCADPQASCPLPFALGDDPPLKPVRTVTYEFGSNWVVRSLVASASAYFASVRDEIFFVGDENAPLQGFFQNLDRTRRLGAEVSVHGPLGLPAGTWDFGYARTTALFETNAVIFSARSDTTLPQNELSGSNRIIAGSHLPMVPENQLKLGLAVKPTGVLDLALQARWIGAQWMRGDEANETRPLPSYTIADARAELEVHDWVIAIGGTNLLNSHSAIFGTFNENQRTGELERFLTPMNARTVRLSVTRLFGSTEQSD
jgi:iron complex outermembrane recepter protein